MNQTITTKEIKLTTKKFFIILLWMGIKSMDHMVMFVTFLGGAFFFAKFGRDGAFEYMIFLMAIVYLFLFFGQPWSYASSKENKLFFRKRYYKIDKDNITAFFDEGNNSSLVEMKYVIKYKFISNSYLLFIAKDRFLYLPIDSFHTKDDLNWFKNEILTQIKGNTKHLKTQ